MTSAARSLPDPHDRLHDLLARRSTNRLQEPAPAGAELDAILDAALRAPDHGRIRPWRYVVIRGEAKRALADLYAEALRRRDPEAPDALVERARGKALNPPLILALGTKLDPAHKVSIEEQVFAVAASAMNILNAIHMLGYGGMWVTGANSTDPTIAAALGFQAPDRLLGFINIGTPAEDGPAVPRPDRAGHVTEWRG